MQAPPDRTQASTPSAPGVYDYLLGGKDNLPADRALAAELEAQAGDGPGEFALLAKHNARVKLAPGGLAQFALLELGEKAVAQKKKEHGGAQD